jgi:hypothetical protein
MIRLPTDQEISPVASMVEAGGSYAVARKTGKMTNDTSCRRTAGSIAFVISALARSGRRRGKIALPR